MFYNKKYSIIIRINILSRTEIFDLENTLVLNKYILNLFSLINKFFNRKIFIIIIVIILLINQF